MQITARRRRPACPQSRIPSVVIAFLLSCALPPVFADEPFDIRRLTLEELMDIDVYSASRRLEPYQTIPGAIYVLTGEDIRRAHANSVPEALRLVPGVEVGRVDANKWAVSMRGFNSREANKLLVMIDGRTVYDPLFSGMLWESQSVMLEDIERIEVIRGPGGTIWGANAVNGVINIITKRARDTHGGLAVLGIGTEDKGEAALRYGWQAGENHHARFYARAVERDDGYMDDLEPHDRARKARAGLRWDWSASPRDDVILSSEVFDNKAGTREDAAFTQDVAHHGGHFLVHWVRRFSETNNLRVTYFRDLFDYNSFNFDQRRHTDDIEFQHSSTVSERHTIVWGAGYRRVADETNVGSAFPFVFIDPPRRTDISTNIFVQDTFAWIPDVLHLTFGVKYETTDYAEPEWMPSVRLAWTPSPRQTWWAAVSRAARVPARLDQDLVLDFTDLGLPVRVDVGEELESEHVWAYELGQRWLVTPQFWYDAALFYNEYRDLATAEASGMLGNSMHGSTHGVELAARWQATDDLRLDAAYTYLYMRLALDEDSTTSEGRPEFIEGLSPRRQANLRVSYNFTPNVELDAILRYVDEIPSGAIPAYTELDMGLSWRVSPGLRISLVGQNLLDAHHPEHRFTAASGVPTETERGVFAKLRWTF